MFELRYEKTVFVFSKAFITVLVPRSLLFNGYRVCFLAQSGRDMQMTAHLRLVQGLRMKGAVLLFHLHAFVAWKEKYSNSTSKRLLPCSSSLFLIYCSLSITYSMPYVTSSLMYSIFRACK